MAIILALGILCSFILPKLNALKGALFAFGFVFLYILVDWFLVFRNGYWLKLLFPVMTIAISYFVINLLNFLNAEQQARLEKTKAS